MLLIIVLLLLFCGGGFFWGRGNENVGPWGGGGIGLGTDL